MNVAPKLDWLPNHQTHVLESLGYIDELMNDVATVLQDESRIGVFTFAERRRKDVEELVVASVRPLPALVPRRAADILTQLRAVLEHVIFAEVSATVGRRLSVSEERSLEMPASSTPVAFDKWVADKRRRAIPVLQAGAPLLEAIRRLQPFAWVGSDDSPLRILADHTNVIKHRAPAIAASHIGKVVPDFEVQGLAVPIPSGRPAVVGDVIVSSPAGTKVGLDVWPVYAMQRPGSGNWKVIMSELAYVEQWVRETALPALLRLGADQKLPPALNVRQGHEDVRAAAALVVGEPGAAARNLDRLQAEGVVRPGLKELLSPFCRNEPERRAVDAWIDSLTDREVITRYDRFSRAAVDGTTLYEAGRQLIRKAVRSQTSV